MFFSSLMEYLEDAECTLFSTGNMARWEEDNENSGKAAKKVASSVQTASLGEARTGDKASRRNGKRTAEETEVIGSSNAIGTVKNSNWEDAAASEELVSLDHVAIQVFQSLDLDNVCGRA